MRSHVWCLIVFLSCFLCASVRGQNRITGETMGTYYSIIIDDGTQETIDKLKPRIVERLAEINRQMSTWDPESEISQFNRSSGTDWYPVSPEFAVVVAEAKRVHELTQGVFDPTVAPLIDLWGFGDRRKRTIPSDEQIAEAMRHIGMALIEVRLEPPAIRKSDPAVHLNLSAIAKGYGVDCISELLDESGHPSHVVDIGGEDRAGTAKSTGGGWRLGVESPAGGLQQVLEVTSTSIATSGDYRNFFEIDGVRYSHAINPVTGRPVENPPASVSVISRTCMTADALATALMVMGTERGMALARQHNLSVMFQDVANDGTVSTEATGVFVEQQKKPDETAAAAWFPFVVALAVFLIAMTGMAAGLIFRNRELKGSCGGLASMPGSDGSSICELCSVPREDCVNESVRAKLAESTADREDYSTAPERERAGS